MPGPDAGARLKIVAKDYAIESRKKFAHAKNREFLQDFLGAFGAYREARVLDSNHRAARFREAECAMRIRRLHLAMDLFRQLLETDSSDVDSRVMASQAAFQVSDYARVLEFLASMDPLTDAAKSSAKLQGFLPELWFYRGYAAEKEHLMPEAIDALQRAARMQPDNSKFHFWLGHAYLGDGKFDLARRSYEATLKADKTHPQAQFGIARAFEKMGRHSDAIDSYKRSLITNAKNFTAHINIARCYEELGDRPNLLKGISHLDQAIELNPLSHEAYHTMQSIQRKLGNKEESSETNEKYNRIRSFGQEQEEKLRAIGRRLQKNPEDIGARLEAIEIHIKFHHLPDAMTEVRDLLNVDPKNAEGLRHMALLLATDGKHDQAYYEALKMIEAAPLDSRGYTIVAGCLHRMKRTDEALPYARKAFESNSADFGALEILIASLMKVGGHEDEVQPLMPLYQRLKQQEDAKVKQLQIEDTQRRDRLLGTLK